MSYFEIPKSDDANSNQVRASANGKEPEGGDLGTARRSTQLAMTPSSTSGGTSVGAAGSNRAVQVVVQVEL